MRNTAAIILLLAATCAAEAQCPLGSYPTTDGDAQTVCQSAAGQRPTTTTGSYPVSCPPGASESVDSWGRRTCSTLRQDGPDRPIGGRIDGPIGGPLR